jgi:hypothetical protein
MKPCDFNRSYLRWSINTPGQANTVRITFDARTEIIDERSGEREEFFLIRPCKSERMYVPRKMWQDPNYDFMGIWSKRQFRIFRTWASIPKRFSTDRTDGLVQNLDERFKDVSLDVRKFPSTRVLRTNREVVKATLGGAPIVAFHEIRDRKRKLSAILEYPVTTMNIIAAESKFQVDTGPLLFPDFASKSAHRIAWLTPAFAVYNTFSYAEFVLRVPTSVAPGVKVMHYSKLLPMKVKTTLMVCE